MLRGQVVLTLLSVVLVLPTLEFSQRIPQTEALPGETVTLTCNVTGDESRLLFWYKMNCGYMIQTVAMGYFENVNLEENFKNLRFEVKKVDYVYSLIIRNIQKEDEAIYFCQAGAAYRMVFISGINLAVNQYNAEMTEKTHNGTTVETRKIWDPVVIGLSVLCIVCVIVIAILVFLRD